MHKKGPPISRRTPSSAHPEYNRDGDPGAPINCSTLAKIGLLIKRFDQKTNTSRYLASLNFKNADESFMQISLFNCFLQIQ